MLLCIMVKGFTPEASMVGNSNFKQMVLTVGGFVDPVDKECVVAYLTRYFRGCAWSFCQSMRRGNLRRCEIEPGNDTTGRTSIHCPASAAGHIAAAAATALVTASPVGEVEPLAAVPALGLPAVAAVPGAAGTEVRAAAPLAVVSATASQASISPAVDLTGGAVPAATVLAQAALATGPVTVAVAPAAVVPAAAPAEAAAELAVCPATAVPAKVSAAATDPAATVLAAGQTAVPPAAGLSRLWRARQLLPE